jgi:hypothetical protein
MGVTVRIVDLIALPKDLIVLVLLWILWDVAGRRDGGRCSKSILLRRCRLPLECSSRVWEYSFVVLDSKTSLSAPGVRLIGLEDDCDFADPISFINAEKTRLGSIGVVDSSVRISMGMGSRKEARGGRGRDFLLEAVVDATRSASLPMLSLDSWITVIRLMARCVSVSLVVDVPQLVTRDVDTFVAFASLWRLRLLRPLPVLLLLDSDRRKTG